MDPTAVEITKNAVGILTSIISWAAVIIIFMVLKNFITAGISRAFIIAFESGSDKTREVLIKFLVDKNMAVPEIYRNLKQHFEGGNEGGGTQ